VKTSKSILQKLEDSLGFTLEQWGAISESVQHIESMHHPRPFLALKSELRRIFEGKEPQKEIDMSDEMANW
jgi:hypothetical protein